MSNTQETLDFFFSKLTALIEKLPLSHENKNLLWVDTYGKFYEEKMVSKSGSYTQGVTTEWQLQKFYEQFRKNLFNSPVKVEGIWMEELEKLDPSKEKIQTLPSISNKPPKSWQARIFSTFA
jgi:hypothetical protein